MTAEDISIAEMKFDNCLAQVEGELSYAADNLRHYEEYLDDIKAESQGNFWRYLRDIRHLYAGSHLSRQARAWNLELLEKSQNLWFSWVRAIPYAGIQDCCLFYAPSTECLTDFMTYLGQDFEDQEPEKQQILAMLLIQNFVERWKNEESDICIREFIQAFLKLPPETTESVLYDMLSEEWISETKILYDQYRKKFRDYFVEMLAEHYKRKLPEVIKSNRWEISKAALRHRLELYCYWADDKANSLEQARNVRAVLWEEWLKVMRSEPHTVHNIYTSEDGFWILWLSGKLMSDEEDMACRYAALFTEINSRLDGWNYNYEKSKHTSDIIFCILTVAAMAAEWRIKQNEDADTTEKFYWRVFEKANKFARGNKYLDEVAKKSLLEIWVRMVILPVQNPFVAKENVILENIRNLDCYECRINILYFLFKLKNWEWQPGEQLKQEFLAFMSEEKIILEKEKSASPLYYEKYYRKESDALDKLFELWP